MDTKTSLEKLQLIYCLLAAIGYQIAPRPVNGKQLPLVIVRAGR